MSGLLFWPLLAAGAVWAGLALRVHHPRAVLPFALAVAVVAALRLFTPWGWPALVLLALLAGGWYAGLRPRQNRDWAPDVARIVAGRVEGDLIHLQNIRAFRWTSADTAAVQHWTGRTLDLALLQGADMITSVWGNPHIAHLLVSFRFRGQPPLVFSVEIRRERGESFSPLGGFFRQFELALIAAEEDDILHWRAVPRAEEVRLYPLTLTPAQLRPVLLGYLRLGNALNARPRFYNTVTSNCTTVVWQLAKAIGPRLPLHRSLLMSGYLPEYLDSFGVLSGPGPLQARRDRALISPRARAAPADVAFSDWIRGVTPSRTTAPTD